MYLYICRQSKEVKFYNIPLPRNHTHLANAAKHNIDAQMYS